MLIWIEGVLEDFQGNLPPSTLNALIELGEAGYMSRHAVVAPRPLLDYFGAIEDLSPRARAYFRRVAEEFTQLAHVLAYPRHVIASKASVAPLLQGGIWKVPFDLFADPRFTATAKIVCENDTDFEVYEFFARVLVREGMPGCTLHAESHAGGGGNTSTVLRRLLQAPNPPFLCILDSDRDVVLGAEGPTARGCRAVWRSDWRVDLVVLNSRELENALPLIMVAAFSRHFGVDEVRVRELPNVDRDLADYACHKTGELLCRFHELDNSFAGYERTVSALRETARKHSDFSKCGNECADCGCTPIPSLGTKFLESFNKWLRSPGTYFMARDRSRWSKDLELASSRFVDMAVALAKKN